MTEYRVRGEQESGVESALPLEHGRLAVRRAVRIDSSMRDEGPETTLEIAEDDLLEVELESGFLLWTTLDRLQRDARTTATRDGSDPLLLPSRYPRPGAGKERGSVTDAIKSLKVLGYDLPERGALAVAEKIEGRLEGDGRFFRISVDGGLSPENAVPDSDAPTLVLVHGTASTTANAYAGLFSDNRDAWREIHEHYEGRVYGFEHRTLTQSPLENALDFLAAVPDGADLHLVTHSRGGLVGDLIAHGNVRGDAFAAEDLEREMAAAFPQEAARRRQLELYREFNRRIAAKAPRVSRYVRVGCPAAGTTLASGRLDVYFSILTNLVRLVPGIGPFIAGFGELVAAVAKERTRPEVLPGLEAQMPRSPFIRLLNGSPHELESDLTVLAGDSEGPLKNLANLFFWRANDLVVDTRSMFGGPPRARRLWHLEENRQVTHVNYFRRSETARVVTRGLLRADTDATGFESRRPKGVARGHVDVGDPTENVLQPAVILLPGIMGSHLRVVDEAAGIDNRVWLDKSDLMKGRGRLLEMGRAEVRPDGVLELGYDDFRDYLARQGVHVIPVAFDWRASLEMAAQRLDEVLRARLLASSAPLHLIAHSMGGVVASLFMARYASSWKKLRENGGRLVQAGTPNLGSYVVPRILLGEEKMIRILAGLDLEAGRRQWAVWASRFPGLLEMAPSFDNLDFSLRKTWRKLGVPEKAVPRAEDLTAASRVSRTLAEQRKKLAEEGVLYVAGGPEETPVYDANEGKIRFTMQGDGRVTWESGIPPGAPTWYVPVPHGGLLDCKSAFGGLRELLLSGSTRQLATERPAASSLLVRGEPEPAPSLSEGVDQIELIPSREDLEGAALGMGDIYGRQDGPPVAPCEVSVVHGDLRFVERPVMVGHYRGDPIVSAEDVLDQRLKGALRSRHLLGLYPGEVGTAEAVLKRTEQLAEDERGPKGAIVLGLGNVGELTPGGLSRAIETGLLRYVQTCRDRRMDTSGLKVAALLVGSGEAGLGVDQIVEAFLVGTGNANRALQGLRGSEGEGPAAALAFIGQLEFVEIYRDVALEALHRLLERPEEPAFNIKKELVRRAGGRRRARATSASGWWSRLSISSREDDASAPAASSRPARTSHPRLTFTAFGQRARVAVTRVNLQAPLVDRFLLETLKSGNAARADLPTALFELLVPQELKAATWQDRDLQLVLDEGSAAFPWELLVDRLSPRREPLGVKAGLLRQLRVENPAVVSHPEERRILVVGDPPSFLPGLPGAGAEATHVAALFARRDWKVVEQIRREAGPAGIDASSVMSALLSQDSRILHLAGHGVYDAEHPTRTGMVLGGGSGDDDPLLLLTPAEVAQMRLQPELVFINCCHLGRIEPTHGTPPLHRLAANLAAQFIRLGVKAVVAPGWPVEDLAAKTFCDAFYEAMLAGQDFGSAVKRARRRTYETHPGTNTWGAYQCYGDPGFRLLMDLEVRSRVAGRKYWANQFVDVHELLIELDNLASRARVETSDGQKRDLAERRAELEALADKFHWSEATGVLAGLARVHGELGEYERAIELHERASRTPNGGITLTDLEQAANYRTRLGKKRGSGAAVKKGIKELEHLIGRYGETAERRSLLAGAYKRLAQLQSAGVSVRKSLREMTSQYARAAELESDDWYYPATNALLGVVLFGGPWARLPRETPAPAGWAGRKGFQEKIARVEVACRQLDIEKFSNAVALSDLAVVRALAEDELEESVDSIVGQYKQAMELYGSSREVGSVVDQWKFAKLMSTALGHRKKAHALGDLIAKLAG